MRISESPGRLMEENGRIPCKRGIRKKLTRGTIWHTEGGGGLQSRRGKKSVHAKNGAYWG